MLPLMAVTAFFDFETVAATVAVTVAVAVAATVAAVIVVADMLDRVFRLDRIGRYSLLLVPPNYSILFFGMASLLGLLANTFPSCKVMPTATASCS